MNEPIDVASNRLRGSIKEAIGKITGNMQLEAEGAQQRRIMTAKKETKRRP